MTFKNKLADLQSRSLTDLTSEETDVLIDEMLSNIGSTDPELRDGLIYPTICRFIEEEGFLSHDQLLHILNTSLDEAHLFYKIGSERDDSVFTRSFSALAVAAALNADITLNYLSLEAFNDVCAQILAYLKAENDARGFIHRKGWAHSVAHGADMLAQLIRNPKFLTNNFGQILDGIKSCIFKEKFYSDQEEERLLVAIEIALEERDIPETTIETWLKSLFDDLAGVLHTEGYSYKYHRYRINLVNFSMTMYFKFKLKNFRMGLRVFITQLLKELDI